MLHRAQKNDGFERVKRALLIFRGMRGEDLLVPFSFTVPTDDASWDTDLWDMKLGSIVSRSEAKLTTKSTEGQELIDMGFVFDQHIVFFRYEKVKRALLTYKSKSGDLLVSNRFVVPTDDETWDEDLWGMKLEAEAFYFQYLDSQ